ncbi:MAG: hypothetical protein WCE23_12830 [Candidatus Binatus sp.]|uniref:hypothetical protein n=1 Tax=Candidatus Binatus sp. TaxID=2811406 RepID=UPI003C76AE4D
MPKLTEDFGRPSFDPHAPLSGWPVFRGFDTASECEQDRQQIKELAQKDRPFSPEIPSMTRERTAVFKLAVTFAVCVSSDDPRLKPK